MRRFFLWLCLPIALASVGCVAEGDKGLVCTGDYDQAPLLNNVANDLIVPAYAELASSTQALKSSMDATFPNLDANSLDELQSLYITAYQSWQPAAQYEFGPAESIQLRSKLNNFPTNEALIEANITAGTYDLDAPDNYFGGFPALDYLLFGLGEDDALILSKYTTEPQAAAYTQYLKDVIDHISEKSMWVSGQWGEASTINEFTDNRGTAAGTSLSNIINALNENFEITKRDRIGIPSGILTLGITQGSEVEGKYAGISLDLAKRSVQASLNLFQGGSGEGLDDILNSVEARKENTPLASLITNQFNTIQTALNAIEGPLETAVDNDAIDVQNAYNELSRQVVNIKTDMPSVLCVAITYVDNPSDSD